MGMKQIFREIRQDWLQFLSIFLMSLMCLLVYAALIGISAGMNRQATAFFEKSNLSDVIVSAKGITSEDITSLEKIAGVEDIEPRLVLTGTINFEEIEDVTLMLTATEDNLMNQPLIVEGAKFGTTDGIWLNKEFVDNYKIKNQTELTITINNQEISIPVAGSIQQPEYLFFPESADYPYPNYEKTAYGFISKDYLNRLMNTVLPSNQVNIRQKNINFTWFQQESQKILGDRYISASETKKIPQISEFTTRQQQVEKLAILFPVLFLILSSLTMVSTMTRFIKKHQVTIGTYKAMGFKNTEIYRYYTSVGFIISGVGSLIGILCGPTLLAPVLLNFLKKQYSIPNWEARVEPSVWIIAFLLVSCCIIMAYIPCRKILQQVPANVLRVQLSEQVKPGWIEQKNIFRFLSFTNHWVARGILRNKSRSLMGIFGAFGCTVLLVAGIGINKSVHYTIDRTYKEINQYEEKVVFEEPLDQEQQKQLSADFDKEEYQWVYQQKIDFIAGKNTVEKTVTVLDNEPLMNLLETTGKQLQVNDLSEDEVFLSHKLATSLGIQEGDTVYFKLKTETAFHPYLVKAIVSIATPQGVITNKQVWQNSAYTYQPTSLLSKKVISKELQDQLADLSFVKTTQQTKTEYKEALKMIQSLMVIISVIVTAAIFLGIVILSNFNLLIFSERFREFATLKVLGFKQSEIRDLSFRENLFLTVLGLGFGYFGGHFFLKAYVGIVSPENQEYIQKFGFKEYLIVAGITLSCSIIINLLLDTNIRRISMAESLKSNE